MNKSKLSFLLLFIAAIPMCNGCSPENSGPHVYKYTLIDAGSTDYEIIIPNECESSEYTAAGILQSYLASSSGVTIQIKEENERNGSKKFISLGNTSAYQNSGFEIDRNSLNGDGYVFKTKDENIYVIAGKGVNSYSYSALELLHYLIDFEGYHDTEIYYKTKTTIGFDDLDFKDVPTFANRDLLNSDLTASDDGALCSLVLRNNPTVFSTWGGTHTSFKILNPTESVTLEDVAGELKVGDTVQVTVEETPYNFVISKITKEGSKVKLESAAGVQITIDENTPVIRTTTYITLHPDWFTGVGKNDQWCYSSEGLLEEVTKRVIKEIETMSASATHVFVSQMDGNNWCSCEHCAAEKAKYGTDAAIMVKFINKLADNVKEYLQVTGQADRDIKIGAFSYNRTEISPTKKVGDQYLPFDEDVVMRDNTFIRIAPIYTDYAKEYTHPNNLKYYDSFMGWNAICKNLIVWNYDTNFSYYFYPFLPYNTIKSNYQLFKKCGVNGIMEQGSYSSRQTGWQELKNYVTAKLLWNMDLNVETLINDFMINFYKEAAPKMKQYFNEYRMKSELLNEQGKITPSIGGVYGNFSRPSECFSLREVDQWLELMDQAIDDIGIYRGFNDELYEVLKNRIEKQTLFPLYVKLFGYESNFSDSELLAMRKRFKEICEKNGILQSKEGSYLTDLYTAWGL